MNDLEWWRELRNLILARRYGLVEPNLTEEFLCKVWKEARMEDSLSPEEKRRKREENMRIVERLARL